MNFPVSGVLRFAFSFFYFFIFYARVSVFRDKVHCS